MLHHVMQCLMAVVTSRCRYSNVCAPDTGHHISVFVRALTRSLTSSSVLFLLSFITVTSTEGSAALRRRSGQEDLCRVAVLVLVSSMVWSC